MLFIEFPFGFMVARSEIRSRNALRPRPGNSVELPRYIAAKKILTFQLKSLSIFTIAVECLYSGVRELRDA